MKKIIVIFLTILFVFLASNSSNAYNAMIKFDSTLDFTQLTGIDVFLDIIDPIGNLSMEVFYQHEGGAIPTHDWKEMNVIFVPYAEWFITTYGAYLTLIDDPSFLQTNPDNTAPASMMFNQGLVFSLKSDISFEINKIDLLSDFDNDGFYKENFKISSTSFGEGKLYTISNVPIPSTLLLLGGGILAILCGSRRKNREGGMANKN